MKSEEALAAEQGLEEKLAGLGIGRDARERAAGITAVGDVPAPDEGTPVADTPTAEDTPAAAEAPADTTELTGDPAVAAYLNKYGGDTTKALQAAVAAQRKLGEMGSEVGEQRRIIAELEQIRADLAAVQQQPQQPQFVDQATVDWIDEQIMSNPATAQNFAWQALKAGNEMLYERVMDQWSQVQPRAASRFEAAVLVEQAKEEFRVQQPQDKGAQVQAALTNVLARNPEFGQYADDMASVIGRYPSVAAGLQGNQQQQEQTIETLFALAERDTLRTLALTGQTPPTGASTQEVATATVSDEHPEQPAPEPTAMDLFRQQFREGIQQHNGERAIPGAYVAR